MRIGFFVIVTIVLGLAVPTRAEPARPATARPLASVTQCMSYNETPNPSGGLDLTIQNNCGFSAKCKLAWKVVCAPQSTKRRKLHSHLVMFDLEPGQSQSRHANASACGDDSWQLSAITWSCTPLDA